MCSFTKICQKYIICCWHMNIECLSLWLHQILEIDQYYYYQTSYYNNYLIIKFLGWSFCMAYWITRKVPYTKPWLKQIQRDTKKVFDLTKLWLKYLKMSLPVSEIPTSSEFKQKQCIAKLPAICERLQERISAVTPSTELLFLRENDQYGPLRSNFSVSLSLCKDISESLPQRWHQIQCWSLQKIF